MTDIRLPHSLRSEPGPRGSGSRSLSSGSGPGNNLREWKTHQGVIKYDTADTRCAHS